MRRLPSFHALRAFEAAARLGSFVRASEELHLTASAISHQVRALEEYFGRHLFEAGSRAKVLTDDGARLAAGLAHAFDAMETACAEVTPKASASTLTVHCAPTFAAKWLGPRLSSFMECHPSISIRMSTGAGSYDLIRKNRRTLRSSMETCRSEQGCWLTSWEKRTSPRFAHRPWRLA
jgi:LysR family transcriptional regulator, glycine cleavage system transcriptional activator